MLSTRPPALSRGPVRCCLRRPSPTSSSRTRLRSAKSPAGALEPGAIAFDIALFSAFALHHSIFARIPVRALVRRIVPEQLERSVYVWVASLMLIGVCYAWRTVPGVLWQVSRPWSWAILAVQLVGIWLTLRSAAVIDGLDLAGVRQASTPPPSRDEVHARFGETSPVEFKTEGPVRMGATPDLSRVDPGRVQRGDDDDDQVCVCRNQQRVSVDRNSVRGTNNTRPVGGQLRRLQSASPLEADPGALLIGGSARILSLVLAAPAPRDLPAWAGFRRGVCLRGGPGAIRHSPLWVIPPAAPGTRCSGERESRTVCRSSCT